MYGRREENTKYAWDGRAATGMGRVAQRPTAAHAAVIKVHKFELADGVALRTDCLSKSHQIL